jgi:hypothetical protein
MQTDHGLETAAGFGGWVSRKVREEREAALERQILDAFSGAGVAAWSQVTCPKWGRADVVTKGAVVEVKDVVNRVTLHQAIGQVILYRQQLNPKARAVIVCNTCRVDQGREVAGLLGVELLVWGDDAPLLFANPPYSRGPKPGARLRRGRSQKRK